MSANILLNQMMMSQRVDDIITVTDVFSADPYTGDGSTPSIVNDIDLDGEGGLVWIKNRDAEDSYILADTVRGAGYILSCDSTVASTLDADTVTAFNADGFTLGADVKVNTNTEDYASWTFRIAPTFFDIQTWVGDGSSDRQISHDLSAIPEMMIVKETSEAGSDWIVYHIATGNTSFGYLHRNLAFASASTVWNDTTPTDSVFTVGSHNVVNQSGSTFIGYFLTTLPEISKCGTYTGNGTSQNLDMGFISGAQMVIFKNTGSGNWIIVDSERGIIAGNDPYLQLDVVDVEDTNEDCVDPYAAGITINETSAANINTNTEEYVYYAVAI